MANFGFLDARTSAELMLAPSAPLKRISLDTSSLKLDLGGLTNIPGAITHPSQITGAIRGTFSAAAVAKSITSSFANALNATYSDFKSGINVSASLDPMFLKNSGVSIDIPGVSATASAVGVDLVAKLPGTQQFVQFSSLRPGLIPGSSQLSAVKDRMSQVQGLASRFSGRGNAPIGGGVHIMENMNRTTYPLPEHLNIPSFPRLSTGGKVAQSEAILRDKTKFVVRGVRVATGKPGFWSRLKTMAQAAVVPTLNKQVGQTFRDATNSGGWSEPAPPYAAQYPYNKATQTESGHIWELDDTPGAERIHIFHRAGSFIEFHPDGSVVFKSMKDGYLLTMKDQNVKVSGKCNIYVGGNTTLFSKGDIDVETQGGMNVNCKKDFNVFAKNINMRAKQTFKADGLLINLRYINLPYQIVPVFGGLAPAVNLAAMRLDFPTGTFDQVVKETLKGPLDEGILPSLLKFQTDAEALAGGTGPAELPENPLASAVAYTVKTPAAAAYRARMFDTPEETQNFEAYAAHIGLQQTLGDTSEDLRQLGGKLTNVVTESTSDGPPPIDFLDFSSFTGKFEYAAAQRLGNTSFTFADLVDTEHARTIVSVEKTPFDAAAELDRDAGVAGPYVVDTTDLTIQGILGSGGISVGKEVV